MKQTSQTLPILIYAGLLGLVSLTEVFGKIGFCVLILVKNKRKETITNPISFLLFVFNQI